MCCGATLGIHSLSKDFITFILGILRLQLISFSGWFPIVQIYTTKQTSTEYPVTGYSGPSFVMPGLTLELP